MSSNRKSMLLMLLFLGAILFYFVDESKNHHRTLTPENSLESTSEESQNEKSNLPTKDSEKKSDPIIQTPEKKSTQVGTVDTSANLVDLTGIDKDFRECLNRGGGVGEDGWVSEIKDNLHGFSALKNDLVRVLGPQDTDSETYREKTIQLPNGETRVVQMESGTSDSPTGNSIYWSKQDDEGALIPDELPKGFDPDNIADFEKLVSRGDVKKTTSTRVITFKNGVELSIIEVNGEIHSISVQTDDHQSFCQLDPTKGYHCDCVY